MKHYLKVLVVVLSFFICSFLIVSSAGAQAVNLAPPSIVKVTGDLPLVSGNALTGAEILIYLDGGFAGIAKSEPFDQVRDTFSFSGQGNLTPGRHKVMAIARDKTSLVLSPPSAEVEFTVGELPAPTLIAPNQDTHTANPRYLIKGLTASNTFVRVYIDNKYNGKTPIVSHDSGTASFAYKPFLNLSRGQHTVFLVAEDESGRTSQPSSPFEFRIELPMPAPTMIRALSKKRAASSPATLLTGLAKNNSLIKVFVNNKYDGQFKVVNSQSGTASFAYKINQALTSGRHLAYTTAISDLGKESIKSNSLTFSARRPSISAVASKEAARQRAGRAAGQAEVKKSTDTGSETTGAPLLDKPTGERDILKDISSQSEQAQKDQRGLINESKQNQSKIRLNIIIFVLFLIGIIGWMLWVNREIIRERRSKENNKDNQDGQDENKT